jgi:hypothetical protein
MGVKHGHLLLRKNIKLHVFENRILRKTYGIKDEVDGPFRIFHDEKLLRFIVSSIVGIVKSRIWCAGYVGSMGVTRSANRILAGKLLGEQPLWKTAEEITLR